MNYAFASRRILSFLPKRAVASIFNPPGLYLLFLFVFTANLSHGQTSCTPVINTYAGTGSSSYSGDGGAATAAGIGGPVALQLDGSGNLFIADIANSVVRKVNAAGVISTVAGNGWPGYYGDGGPATDAALQGVSGIATDGAGNLYIVDGSNQRIRKVDTAGTITTFAGNGTAGYSGDGGPATAAELYYPAGVAADAAGNVYIADNNNSAIRKIDLSGIITTVAGTGTSGFSGDGGPATAAELGQPTGIAIDAAGNMYIADESGSRIRKVNTSGIITTIAGTGGAPLTGGGPLRGDGGPATAATLGGPHSVAVDAVGDVFVADGSGNVIRKISTSGIITRVVGSGSLSPLGDGGPATAAGISVGGVAIDAANNLYLTDQGRIRIVPLCPDIAPITGVTNVCVATTTSLSESAIGGTWSSSNPSVATIGSSIGVVYGVSAGTATISYATTLGSATATVSVYTAVGGISGGSTVYTSSLLTLSDSPSGGTWSSSDTSIAAVGSSGTVRGVTIGTTTISYTLGGSCLATTVVSVNTNPITGGTLICQGSTLSLADATSGGVWNSGNPAVASVDSATGVVTGISAGTSVISYTTSGSSTSIVITVSGLPSMISFGDATFGNIMTYAGNGGVVDSGDGGPATAASISQFPSGMAFDAAGNLYVAEPQDNVIRKVSPSGIITTVAGNNSLSGYSGDGGPATAASLGGPTNVAIDASGNLYIADLYNYVVRKVNSSGIITTVVGNNAAGYSGDGGPATAASISGAEGLCFDAGGNLYFVDGGNYVVRKVSPSGIITTFAGGGVEGYSGDGGPATAALLNQPFDVAADRIGNIYISDLISNVVRKVDPSGIITTYAGTGAVGYTGDGGPASAATFSQPTGLTTDPAGNLYIADYFSSVIRKVSTSGTISTIAGNGSIGFSGDGGPATAASFNYPNYVSSDGDGNIFVTDGNNFFPVWDGRVRKIISNSVATSVCVGATATLYDAASGGTWSSSNTAVATIGSTGILTGVAGGTTTVTYTLSSGCPTTTVVTVGASAGAISGPSAVAADSTVTLSDPVSGGVWSSSNTSVATVDTTGIVGGVSTGTSTISYAVTNACGTAYATHTVTVNVGVSPILGATSVCAGSAVTLSDTTSGGSWSSSNTAVATVGSTGTVSAVSAGTTTISYTVSGNSATVVVTVNAAPAAISGASSLCTDATTILSDATSGGVWSSSNTSVASISATGTVSGVSSGTAVISYTNSCGWAVTTVTVNDAPSSISGITSLCSGSTVTLSDATSSGAWTSSNISTATVDASGIVYGVSAGTSTITYALGSCYATTVVTVSTTPASISGATSLCSGSTVTLSDGTSGGAWSSSTTSVATISSSGAVSGVSAGTSTITYALGSCYATMVVTVSTTPASISGTTSLCSGSTVTLSDATSSGAWTSSNISVATVDASGIVYGVAAGTSTITYSLGSCYATTVATVSTTPASILGTTSLCSGSTATLSDATSSGAWTSSNTSVATISSSGVVSGVSAGTSTITYALGSCDATMVVTVSTTPASISGTTSLCSGSTVTLSDATSSGAWTSSNISVATVDASGIVYGVSAGTSTITYTLGSCYATTVVTVSTTPASISGTTSLCSGSTITLSDATSSGAWTSSNISVATVDASGIVYGVSAGTSTITYALGSCYATTVVTVSTTPASISGTRSLCSGSTVTLSDATSSGAWASSNISMATVDASGIVYGVSAGTSTITYALGSCYATTVVTVSTTPASISGTTSLCSGSTVTLSDATSSGAWSSSNTSVATISSSGVVSGVSAGTSVISYTIGSCYAVTTVTVNSVSAISGIPAVTVGSTTALTDAASGGAWSSSNISVATVDASGIVYGVAAGTSAISYTSGSGCIASIVVTVTSSGGGSGGAPVITSVSSLSAVSSASLTINGLNFNAITSGNVVYFGATKATVTAASSTLLGVSVPSEAIFSPITVTNTSNGLTGYSQYPFLPTFDNSAYIIHTVHFDPKVDFASGTQPYSVAIGDIDGDGNADIVASNMSANTISVFRNTASSGSISGGSFSAKVDFTTGSQPHGVAIADIDGDGKLDVVVANNASNTVSVFRNTATSGSVTSGSMASKVDFTTGTNPVNVAVNDIDGDGKADLVVANFYSSTVSVLRNTGSAGSVASGSFASKVDFTVGTYPGYVALGDIDGDGKPDIVTANGGAASISVLRNTATSGSVTSSSFASKVDFTAGTQPCGIALADIDGDGKIDVLAVNNYSATMSVFRNTASSGTISSSSLAAKVDFSTGVSPSNVSVGDADGDGKPDVMVANTASNTVSVFRNTSSSGSITSSSLAAKADYTTGSGPKFVAVGDLDGDGKPDMAVADISSNAISVLRNNPLQAISGTPVVCSGSTTTVSNAITGGTWSSSNTAVATVTASTGVITGIAAGTANITYSVVSGSAYVTATVTAPPAPITGPSLVCAGSSITLSNSAGGGTWSSNNTSVATAASSTGVISGVAAGSATITYSISAGCYTTKYVTVNPAISAISGTTSLCAGSSVTLSDVTSGGTWSSSNTTVATINSSAGVVTAVSNGNATITYTASCGFVTTTVTVSGEPSISSVSAYNGFPASSVTISGSNFNPSTSSNIVYFGATQATVSSAGSTSLSVTVPNGATYQPISVENTACSLTAYSQYPFLPTFDNTSYYPDSIRLTAKVDFASNTNPFSVAIGDIDGDGKPDLVATDYGANKISVYRNTSSGDTITSASFAAKVDFATGTAPYGLAIGDIDNDGKLDIAVANNGSAPPTVSVFRNTATSGAISSSSLAAKVDFGAGTGPIAVAICDFDKDGKADLAVANNAANTISILRNTGSSGSISSSSFATKVDVAAGTHPFGIATGDMDDDGRPDIIVPNQAAASVSVFQNASVPGTLNSSSFALRYDFTTGSQPYGVAIGDIDGDGKPDIAVPDNGSGTVSVLRNTTSGSIITFAAKVDFTTGSGPYSVALADMNGDGKPEMIVANRTSNTVSIFRNTATSGSISSGSFFTKKDCATGSAPVCVAACDLDADGRPDVVTANIAANTVSVLKNWLRLIGGSRFGTGQETSSAFGDITVIPNPNKGTFIIKGSLADDKDQEVTIEIADMLGQVIYRNKATATSGQVNEQVQLDNSIANGMYLLSLKSESENKVFHIVVSR